jgi:DNA polymerase-3 subunit gamma/tau
MYIVLARKYRSQVFDDVVGQEPIAQTLKNAIKTGKVAHAYLFTGTRGVGKTTMARILAKALNCLAFDGPTEKPCCKCDSCVAVNKGEDIDVIEIDGASNRGIDNIRELIQNATYRPARARYKIYIIDEVHMLTIDAFNALLKILEEPPSHIKFIFATTEPNKVPATIQSRCQRFDFRNISPRLITAQMENILQKEKIDYEKPLVILLAKMANGSMRDGLSLLDRLISTGEQPLTLKLGEELLGLADSEKMSRLVEQIADKSAAGTIEAAGELMDSGLSEVQIVDLVVDFLRDLLLVKSVGSASELLVLTEEQKQKAVQLADKFDVAGLVYGITALEKTRWAIKNSENNRALLEAILLRLALSEHFLNIDQLTSKQANTGEGGLKKNKIADISPAQANKVAVEPERNEQSRPLIAPEVGSIKKRWPDCLQIITQKLGSGTSSLLARAVPTKFENDCLTLVFDASAGIQKRMCESNGRLLQIQNVLSDFLGKEVTIVLELGTEVFSDIGKTAERNGRLRQRENEVTNDPAVKTILTELGATITKIEQNGD